MLFLYKNNRFSECIMKEGSMDNRSRERHEIRKERIRLQKIRRRQRRLIILVELLILGGLFYVAYEMEQSGRFQVKDISNIEEEVETENIVEEIDIDENLE